MQREPLAPTEILLAAVVLPLAILVPTWLATPTPEHPGGLRADQLYYAAMALRDSTPEQLSHVAPWCWRILTPFQVSLWPIGSEPFPDVIQHFKRLAFASNWLSLVLLYALLRRLGAGPAARVFGVLAYAGIHWTVKFSFRAPGYVDFQMQLLIIAVLLCMVARRYWLTLPLFALAAIQKETALLLLPAVALHRWNHRSERGVADAAWIAGVLALPLIALVAVRGAIPPVNDFSAAAAVGRVLGDQLLDAAFWPRFGIAIFSGLGLLPLLLAWSPRETAKFLRDEPHWGVVLVCGLLALVGGVDKARLFLPMTPAIVVIAVCVWRPALHDNRHSWRALAWMGLTLALNAYLGHHFEPMGEAGAALARLAPIHAQGSLAGAWVRVANVAGLWFAATAVLRPFDCAAANTSD
jgi:hypothetical protein